MKTLFAAVSAIGLLAASPAYADTTGTGEIALNATVAPACGIDAHKSGAQSAPGWDQNDITVDLTNGGNGQPTGQTETNRSYGPSEYRRVGQGCCSTWSPRWSA